METPSELAAADQSSSRKRQRAEISLPDSIVSSLAIQHKKNSIATPVPVKLPTSDNLHPQEFLKRIFESTTFGKDLIQRKRRPTFQKPSQEEIDAYDMQAVSAVRSGDIAKLRVMARDKGKSFNACNRFGESLIHMACRRGDVKVVRFLVREAAVRTDIRDDYGRTPAHDACWTSKPNLDVMEELLQVLPVEMFLSEDVRGFTPFQYARREHWAQWVQFLSERQSLLFNRLNSSESMVPVVKTESEPLKIAG